MSSIVVVVVLRCMHAYFSYAMICLCCCFFRTPLALITVLK